MDKLIRDMTEPELRRYFRGLTGLIESYLPPGPSASGKCLFALIVADMVRLLRETADWLEHREDIPR
jgi:hypothetical protein